MPFEYAAQILTAPLGDIFAIAGGAAGLALTLEQSIKQSGGRVRLNTPALRLAHNPQGDATGVVLLSGETVEASKAVISNLTIWDTYGKLVGLNRTPSALRQELKALRSNGSYFVYLGIDEDLALSLGSSQLVVTSSESDAGGFNPDETQLFVALAPQWDHRAPDGKRAITVHAFTDVDDWFTFHTDETEHEEQDQQMLERIWQRLGAVLPALVTNAEVIDTDTPRTLYELTRRKLGMVGSLTHRNFGQSAASHQTSVPNLFIISDTTSGGSLAELSKAALSLADLLT